jgi:non-ribosomal peptide synthase protein (TIGR01720 family)
VAAGVIGELLVGGAGVARGYRRRPGLTAERFVPDPDGEGDRLYRSGDLARYRHDGEIDFVGRADHQVKVHGYRIELGEIESVLAAQPDVAQAVALVRQPPHGEPQLVAYATPRAGASLSGSDLRTALRRRLPEYMTPLAVLVLPALPLTPQGKLDRRALPAPATASPAADEDATAQTPMEAALAQVWAEVLQTPVVSRRANFFELGGDSILSMQIVARARARQVVVSPWQVFHYQTIAELATVAAWSDASGAEPTPETGDVPLTPMQHWFFERQLIAPHHHNQSVLLEPGAPLDAGRLERAFALLLAHHDGLRARFTHEAGGWRQRLTAHERPAFTHLDLSSLADGQQTAAVARATSTLQASLDLTDGPIVRLAYVSRRPARRDLLFIVAHHLVVDGVSWRILLDDLQRVYHALARNEAPTLPPKSTSVRRWAELMRDHANSDALRSERGSWLADDRDRLALLPRDWPRGENTVGSTASLGFELTEPQTRALIHDAPRVYRARIGDVLMTALGEALLDWCDGDAIAVDVEGHGRDPIVDGLDLSRTVGWFTSLYPVVLRRRTTSDLVAQLRPVREQLRPIAHGGLGYGVLRYLAVDPDIVAACKGPRAEVAFNYLGQFDQVLSDGAFMPASESAGAAEDPRQTRPWLCEITAWIAQNQLRVACRYSTRVHTADTIAGLVERLQQALATLADRAEAADARSSIADFPLAHLSEGELDAVLRTVRAH